MRTVTYRLADLNRATIPLGFVGENQHTCVIFDAAKVFAEYPDAVPALTVQPPQGTSYPAVVVRDGDYVQFDVSDSDLIHAGTGELQLAFVQDAVKVRTYIARTRIDRSIVPTGEIPEPLEDFLEAASAAVAAIPQEVADGVAEGFGAVTAEAETLAPGSSATAEFDTETKVLTIGVPVGERGQTGPAGADGFSPVASVSKSGDTATISIMDKTGTTTATVKDGTDGQDGQPGADGYSPSASVSKSGATATITITDKNGTTTATVYDGTPVIDDTAGSGDTDKVWSADKSAGEVSLLNNAISEKYTKPNTGIPASDLESGVIPSVPVQDVQVNGTSVLSQGVANIPQGSSSERGVFLLATTTDIKSGSSTARVITPGGQHTSAFYGLAKAAGADMKDVSGATVGVYPDAQKIAIQKMLGIYEPPFELVNDITLTERSEINLTADDNNNPYNFRSVFIEVFYAANLVSETGGYGRYRFYDADNKFVATETGRYATNTAQCFKLIEVNRVANKTSAYYTRQSQTGSAGAWQTKSYYGYAVQFDLGNIVRIATPGSEGDIEPAGTRIRIWAQWAY